MIWLRVSHARKHFSPPAETDFFIGMKRMASHSSFPPDLFILKVGLLISLSSPPPHTHTLDNSIFPSFPTVRSLIRIHQMFKVNLSVGALSRVRQMIKTKLPYAGEQQGHSDCTVCTWQEYLSITQILILLFDKKKPLWSKLIERCVAGEWLLLCWLMFATV